MGYLVCDMSCSMGISRSIGHSSGIGISRSISIGCGIGFGATMQNLSLQA